MLTSFAYLYFPGSVPMLSLFNVSQMGGHRFPTTLHLRIGFLP